MDFFKKFEKLCYERGMSKTAVLAAAGVNKSAVTRWKRGEKPSVRNATLLSEYFNIPIAELMGDDVIQSNTESVTSDEDLRLLELWHMASYDDKELIGFILNKYKNREKKII